MIILIIGLRLNLSPMMISWPIYWLIHLLVAAAMWLASTVLICTNRARPTPTSIKTIPLLRNRE
ncbi:hypothetical protein Golob_011427, partial [Gossypium lobatum]|nr:hypothetical protein [Gossypium lobatum]